MSISVRLLQPPEVKPTEMAAHAAKMCYNAETPTLGEGNMDVMKALFDKAHHTTFEHSNYTFVIEGISVGDITLGFHLANPFYNTDQRSGRYCIEMFANPDVIGMARYIRSYYPEVSDQLIWEITDYVEACIATYGRHQDAAITRANRELARTRPHLSEKAMANKAKGVAQEQLRVLIPVIMPTAFDYTINIITLVALYRSAHTPVMRAVTAMMADEAVKHDPNLRPVFKRDEIEERPEWMGISSMQNEFGLVESPTCKVISITGIENFVMPEEKYCHPVDQLHFRPESMNNRLGHITTELTMSLMTMGQNQRHRTVGRGLPIFTGDFYLPPLLAKNKQLYGEYVALGDMWRTLCQKLPPALSAIIAPYGAVVRYQTCGDFSALIHEHSKRLCWNAQEEIYNISRLLREAIIQLLGRKAPILEMFEPPCFRHGKCLEGDRCCGRSISVRNTRATYYPRRAV